MGKSVISALIFLFVSLLSAETVYAYNYAEAEDPMALIFKSAVAAAAENNWVEVSRQAKKGIALQKGHLFEADYLLPRIEKSIQEKDVSGTAELFAHLVYLSICEKLHINKKERLSSYKDARARMHLAYKSYLDILDGNVKKHNAEHSNAILEQFQAALNSIGNPGLFGIGKKPPNLGKYDQATKTIEDIIFKTFPSFKK